MSVVRHGVEPHFTSWQLLASFSKVVQMMILPELHALFFGSMMNTSDRIRLYPSCQQNPESRHSSSFHVSTAHGFHKGPGIFNSGLTEIVPKWASSRLIRELPKRFITSGPLRHLLFRWHLLKRKRIRIDWIWLGRTEWSSHGRVHLCTGTCAAMGLHQKRRLALVLLRSFASCV